MFDYTASKNPLFILDSNFKVAEVNLPAVHFIKDKYNKEILPGSYFPTILSAPEREIFVGHFSRALTGDTVTINNFIVHGDVFINSLLTPVQNNSYTDIRKVSCELSVSVIPNRGSSEQLADEAESMPYFKESTFGWWELDLDSNKIFLDARMWEIMGFNRSNIPGDPNLWRAVLDELGFGEIISGFWVAAHSGKSCHELTKQVSRITGEPLLLRVKGAIKKHTNGVPASIVALARAHGSDGMGNMDQESSANYLRTIFRNTEVGYIFLDKYLTILSFNLKARTISWNLNGKDLIADQNILDAVNEARFLSFRDNINEALRGQRIEYERCIAKQGGDEEWYSLKLSPVFDHSDEVTNIIISLEDISERKRDEIQLNKSFDLVSAQNKRLMNFSYIVSHNLRSHASNITSIVDFLLEADTEAERVEMVQHLKTVSTSLDETLNNLNDIISINTSINLIFEPLLLNAYIKRALDILSDQIHRKNAVILNRVNQDVVINYNPAYIESIILNFLSNALKYSDPGRQPVVTINCWEEKGKPVLSVADNGIGIDLKKNGDKLFGLYKTFNGNTDARGIGLFITKNQVEYMGGRIEVESELGKGTIFKIYF